MPQESEEPSPMLAFIQQMRHEPRSLPLYLTAFILILITYGLRFWLLKVRFFDRDEFQHLHSAWYISKGMLPYRDYFDHHTPLFHFLLAPFFAFFKVDTDVSEAIAFIFLTRQCMWMFTGIILVLAFWLGKIWRDERIACVATLFLTNTIFFFEKTLEIRPDLLAVIFWLGCLIMLVRAIQSDDAESRKIRWLFAGSGALLGLGILCTQKLLFALPGMVVVVAWYLIDPRSPGTFQVRFRNLLFQFSGFCSPILLMLLYFLLRGTLNEFIEYNLLLNLRWKRRFTPYDHLQNLVRQNPFLVAFGIVGLIRALVVLFRHDTFRRGEFVLVLNTIGLVVGLFLMPVPHRQYYLLFLPLVAILAGTLFVDAVATLAQLPERQYKWPWPSSVAVVLLAVLLGITLWYTLQMAKPRLLTDTFYPIMWIGVLVGVVILLIRRHRDGALALLLIALSIYPLHQMRGAFRTRNTGALNDIRYIIENTTPQDTIMDGSSGRGVFRPHAYFYYILFREIRLMISDQERLELLEALRSGRIAPKLTVLDKDLRALSPEIRAFFEEHYEPVGQDFIWQRKEDLQQQTDENERLIPIGQLPLHRTD
jgi:4-amino-4-deoxy-L-arabinose transferase-like glycosyltransferase